MYAHTHTHAHAPQLHENILQPWYIAKEKGAFAAADIDLEYCDYPGGTGAMTKALNDNMLDAAILLTEGCVKVCGCACVFVCVCVSHSTGILELCVSMHKADTHTHTPHTHTHTRKHTHPLSLSLSLSLTHTHTHTHAGHCNRGLSQDCCCKYF